MRNWILVCLIFLSLGFAGCVTTSSGKLHPSIAGFEDRATASEDLLKEMVALQRRAHTTNTVFFIGLVALLISLKFMFILRSREREVKTP